MKPSCPKTSYYNKLSELWRHPVDSIRSAEGMNPEIKWPRTGYSSRTCISRIKCEGERKWRARWWEREVFVEL